jgi:ABC-type multidrug transport system ATPase subunit
VELRDASKRFGAIVAIDRVDLVVETGEIVVLVGANGCGKSTLLRLVAGTIEPDGGSVRVAGRDVVRERRAARSVTGVMFGADWAWYPRLTGRENLEFFARLEALGPQVPSVVESALWSVGLEHAADSRVGGYSTGMRARLALARARLAEPEVLILDEPAATLDAASTRDFRGRLLHGDGAPAVLMATHDVEEASAVADRIVVLRRGVVAREFPGSAGADELRRELAA